jgi:hypothetical protein
MNKSITISNKYYETGQVGENIPIIVSRAILAGKKLVECNGIVYYINWNYDLKAVEYIRVAECEK